MPYDNKQIAQELQATAMGHAYYGNALRVVLDKPRINDIDRGVICRFERGDTAGNDHIELQDIANRLMRGELD